MIALLSDTHGNVEATRCALALLAAHEPREYLHLGDIGSAAVVDAFAGLPVRFIWGNVDHDVETIAAAVAAIGATIHDALELDVAGHRAVATHGHSRAMKQAQRDPTCELILHGHTHVRRDEVVGGKRFINPGALHRAATYTCAVLDPETLALTFVEVPKL
jgi:putative phosphoesterase